MTGACRRMTEFVVLAAWCVAGVRAARVSINERLAADVQAGCSKAMATYMCNNLISWHESSLKDVQWTTKKPLDMSDKGEVKCAIKLVKKYGDKVATCTEALGKLLDGGHISAEDVASVDALKDRPKQTVLQHTGLTLDVAPKPPQEPTCPTLMQMTLTFPTVTVKTPVKASGPVGHETTVECGAGTRDPASPVTLRCTASEDPSEKPRWRIKSGECFRPRPTCPKQGYKITFRMGSGGEEVLPDVTLKFDLPLREFTGPANLDFPLACSDGKVIVLEHTPRKRREVTGGNVYFECDATGRWIIGDRDNDCTFTGEETAPADHKYVTERRGKDEPQVAPTSLETAVTKLGEGACGETRMRFSYAGGTAVDFNVDTLPETANGRSVTMPCSKQGWSGEVTYVCKDSEWAHAGTGKPFCYKPDRCLAIPQMRMRISGSVTATLTFSLRETSLSSDAAPYVEYPCSGAAKTEPPQSLKGHVRFKCAASRALKDGRPEWSSAGTTCQPA